jgi:hypothetical protein
MTDLRAQISAELTLLDFRGFDVSAALRVALGDVMYRVAATYGAAQAQAMKAQMLQVIHAEPVCAACAEAVAAAIDALPAE